MNKKLKDIKQTGFKTPKDYFSTLEDAVLDQIKTDDLLKGMESTGYSLPEGYLSSVEDNVFNKLDSNKDVKVVSLLSRRNLLYMSGVAAAIVILFSVFIKNEVNTNEELDYDMVENYIMQQDISSYELAALLTEEELESINSEVMDEAFTDDEMETYLLENVNIEEIIEQ